MFDLDNIETEIDCPNCGFYNTVYFKDIKLRNVIICRGCKFNLQLDDYMNSYKIESRKLETEFKKLSNLLNELF